MIGAMVSHPRQPHLHNVFVRSAASRWRRRVRPVRSQKPTTERVLIPICEVYLTPSTNRVSGSGGLSPDATMSLTTGLVSYAIVRRSIGSSEVNSPLSDTSRAMHSWGGATCTHILTEVPVRSDTEGTQISSRCGAAGNTLSKCSWGKQKRVSDLMRDGLRSPGGEVPQPILATPS
jgi:hypothetical protein